MASPLAAQDRNADEPVRQATGVEREGRAAAAAKERALIEGGAGVTFQDVLNSPDDPEINFRYAQAQVAGGNLKGAAATLERILLIDPGLARVRLLYAVVLYRLDNLSEAEAQLAQLEQIDAPPEVKAEMRRFAAQIEQRRKTLRGAASLTIGYHHDSNRNSGPSSATNLLYDNIVDASGGSLRNDDEGVIAIGSASLRYDLGFQARHELVGSVTYVTDDQASLDSLDTKALGVEAGGIYRAGWADLTPMLFASRVTMAGEKYYWSEGAKLKASRTLDMIDPRLNAYVEGLGAYDNYYGLISSPTTRESRGPRYGVTLGGSFAIDQTMSISASYEHTSRFAYTNWRSYVTDQVTLGHDWLLGRGQFLSTAVTAGVNRYDSPEAFISSMTRRDETYRSRVTYGVALDALVGDEGPLGVLSGLTWSASAEYYRQLSDIKNYTYANRKLQTMLTRRWEF